VDLRRGYLFCGTTCAAIWILKASLLIGRSKVIKETLDRSKATETIAGLQILEWRDSNKDLQNHREYVAYSKAAGSTEPNTPFMAVHNTQQVIHITRVRSVL